MSEPLATRARSLSIRRWSLRARLTLWMVAIAFVIQAALSLVALFYHRNALNDFFQVRFRVRAQNIADALRKVDCRVDDDAFVRICGFNLAFQLPDRWVETLYDEHGEVVASTFRPAAAVSNFDFPAALVRTFPAPTRRTMPGPPADSRAEVMRVGLMRVEDSERRPFVLMLASDDAYFENMIRLSGQLLLFTIPAGVIAAAIGGWMIAGFAVAPYIRLSRLAGAILPDVPGPPVPAATASANEAVTLEEELKAARHRLRAALLAQERFISNVSHELKTPIAVLLTEAQTLPDQHTSPETKAFVRSVVDEMRLLGRMVEGFLTLTTLRGGKSTTQSKRCNLNEIVMEAVEASRKMAAQYGVRLMPELWDGVPTPVILGDPDLLRIMVDNLVRNAVRFSPEGAPVRIGVRVSGADCEIRVDDEGPGVPEKLLDTLFDRFVQAPEEAQRGRGQGLGLSIAQGIAELHGGTISVRNVPTGGCEFTVRLNGRLADAAAA